MRTRGGLRLFSEKPDWIIEKIWGLWPLTWNIKYLLGDPTLSGRRIPQTSLFSGSVVAPDPGSSFLSWILTGQVLALPLPSLEEEAPLWPAPCILGAEQSLSQEPCPGLLRAGTLCWFSAFYGFRADWAARAEMSECPVNSRVPFLSAFLYLQPRSGHHCGWAVLLCWALCPPNPYPHPHFSSSTKIHQEQSLELEPKPVAARGFWRCKVVRNRNHFCRELLTSYGEPALALGKSE